MNGMPTGPGATRHTWRKVALVVIAAFVAVAIVKFRNTRLEIYDLTAAIAADQEREGDQMKAWNESW
jgi:hypothetical protein